MEKGNRVLCLREMAVGASHADPVSLSLRSREEERFGQ